MSKSLKELQVLESSNIESVVNDDSSIEKSQSVDENNVNPMKKEKKPRTAKQIEAFEKARKTMMENNKIRQDAKKINEENNKKVIEEKIVKKAISIKKKEIKQQAVLDEISDDDEPIEKVIEKKKKILAIKKNIEIPKSAPRVIYF